MIDKLTAMELRDPWDQSTSVRDKRSTYAWKRDEIKIIELNITNSNGVNIKNL